ncbi:MAG: helix-turn-helix domain-containing protein [Akkermansia muciniphila]
MMTREENIFFDRKSSKVKLANLAEDIVAFANAEGGTLAIGLSDDGTPEGISGLSDEQINDFAEAPLKVCKPMPMFGCEFFPVTNRAGKPDRILVLYIQSHPNGIIRTAKDVSAHRRSLRPDAGRQSPAVGVSQTGDSF